MILNRREPIVTEETITNSTETTYFEEYNNLNNNEMSKKIFICGKVYQIDAESCVTIHKRIQSHIDRLCNDPDNPNERLVTLLLDFTELSNGSTEITFTFSRNNLFAKSGVNPELINDSDGQLILGMGGSYTPPVLWELVQPIGKTHRYHIPLTEFIYAYAESVKAAGASELQGLRIESSRTEFSLRILI